jgi:hypothetical protein
LQPSLFEEYKLINKIICYVKNESIIYLQWQMFLNKLLFVKIWGYWHHLKVLVLTIP